MNITVKNSPGTVIRIGCSNTVGPVIHLFATLRKMIRICQEDDLVELKCNIIQLDKKTMSGVLELYGKKKPTIRPFTATSEVFDDCLEAFKAPIVNVIANKEIEINALGEITIIRYHAVQVRVQR